MGRFCDAITNQAVSYFMLDNYAQIHIIRFVTFRIGSISVGPFR